MHSAHISAHDGGVAHVIASRDEFSRIRIGRGQLSLSTGPASTPLPCISILTLMAKDKSEKKDKKKKESKEVTATVEDVEMEDAEVVKARHGLPSPV